MNNKGYDDSFIERLKFNSDIISTIGKYVTLNQKGKTHWGNCPFHSEKTPSFAVNGMEQFYHCFGCGESGDVIKFIEKIESVDFMTAVKILADAAGMEVPDFIGDDNLKEKKEKKDAILKANKDAAIYYNKMLYTEKGKAALNYLYKRGLNKETITKFGLGVSIDWFDLITHLKKLGHKEEVLIEAGLAERGSKGGLYDIMAERLMFPIINSFGEVIGFSARALKDGKFAKYRNTAQTPVFDKSRVVYAINLLKQLKQTEKFEQVILVEGQMDVIAMHLAGFKNSVACMGTALTKYHSKELKRFTDKVIVSFDGDAAGQKATLRSLEILEEEGLKVYVIALPEKLDPDEYVKKYGKAAYQKLLDEAMPLNDYKLKAIASEFDLEDNKQRTKFIDTALEEIKNLKSSYEREIYLKQLSERTKVDINTLQKELDYKIFKSTKQAASETDTREQIKLKAANVKSAEFVLASVIYKKPYAKLPENNIFELENHIKLYDFILKSQNLKKEVKIGELFTVFDVDNNIEMKDIINFDLESINNAEKYFKECIKNLHLEKLLKQQKELIEQIEKTKEMQEKMQLMKDLNEINKKINLQKKIN
jgi:DNA primase